MRAPRRYPFWLLALLLVALAGVTLAPRLVPGLVRASSAEQVAAMRPEFAGDVPATGSTTHYAITLTVSADLSQVEGQQRVTFVNQETTALDFGDTVFSDVALYDVTIAAPAGQVLAASGVCQPAVGPATPAGVADAAIDRPLEEYAGQQYLDVVYGKAPLFFDAVHGAAGDGAFRRFLRDYFSARRYAIAGPAELRAALAEIIDAERLDAIYGRWTRAQP